MKHGESRLGEQYYSGRWWVIKSFKRLMRWRDYSQIYDSKIFVGLYFYEKIRQTCKLLYSGSMICN